MPNYRWTLSAHRPKRHYPKELKSLGDHLKARRLDIGLTQKQVAARLAVDADSIRNWESGRTAPAVRHYPSLFGFLGYNPLPEPTSNEKVIERERMTRGWSRRMLALMARVDEVSVRRLESGGDRVSRRIIRAVHDVLGIR